MGLRWLHRAHMAPVPFSPRRAEATHLHLVPVLRGAAAPHLLHQPRQQVVGAESPAGELTAALGAGGDAGAALPVALDAGLAEVVHAVQHDGLAEELVADGTRQLLPQAAVLAPAGHPCWHTGPTLSFLPPPSQNPVPSGLEQTPASPHAGLCWVLWGRVWLPDLVRKAQDLPRCCTGRIQSWKAPNGGNYREVPAKGHSHCRRTTFSFPLLQQDYSQCLTGTGRVSLTGPQGRGHLAPGLQAATLQPGEL